MTDKSFKSDDRVGHLNTDFGPRGRNLNDPIFKSSNSRAFPGGEGVLRFRVDPRINWKLISSVPGSM